MANDERDGVRIDKPSSGASEADSNASPGAVTPGFDARLSALRHRYPADPPVGAPALPEHDGGDVKLMGFALRIGVEFVAAVAVGCGLGFLADQALDSRPGGFVVGFFLGAMAGFLSVYRYAMRMMGPVPVTKQEQVDGGGDGSEI